MTTTDDARQQAQDLLVHIEELLAEVDDPTANEAVARLTAVVALLDGTEERAKPAKTVLCDGCGRGRGKIGGKCNYCGSRIECDPFGD